jgi:hypothetical protein|tara:strand:- start:2375 stop:3811 length:1437 start_codon:yes stop_codon:yes gene_type:complete
MDESVNTSPVSYADWIDLGRVIIPCLKGTPEVKNWASPDFKITKEEWKQKYSHCEIALRLDQDTDFDIDNPIVRRFTDIYLKNKSSIFGRDSNPTSHYIWNEKLKFKQFILPKELEKFCKKFPHGNTLCEIRSDAKHYTIVPESQHSKADEIVRWESYKGFNKYPGDLKIDLGKIALSTALCILYAGKGQRDAFCTAVAGVLITKTQWSEQEINEFIYEVAIAANDEESNKRDNKGTTVKKAQRKFGMPKLAEIVGCETRTIATLFSWIGIKEAASEEAQESIGEIVEYGSDRYFVTVNSVVEGNSVEKRITVDGPTLRNKKLFYDAVISKASVWIPEMKQNEFDQIMRLKYESRSKSDEYVEEAQEDNRFIKNFKNYIAEEKAYTNKKELAYFGMPYYNIDKRILEFNLDKFEDYLHRQKINLARVDLVIKCQSILKAKKNHGKFGDKSCVSWRILNQDLDKEDLIVDGEYEEIAND